MIRKEIKKKTTMEIETKYFCDICEEEYGYSEETALEVEEYNGMYGDSNSAVYHICRVCFMQKLVNLLKREYDINPYSCGNDEKIDLDTWGYNKKC